MSELLVGAVIFGLSAFLFLHALARRSTPAADVVTDHIVCEPARDLGGGSREHAQLPDPNVWQSVTVADLATAEELLDLAEAYGYSERELVVLGESAFLVRWRGPV